MQLTVHGNKSHRVEPMEAAKCGGHPNYEFRGALHRGTGKADGQVRGVPLRWLVLHCLRPCLSTACWLTAAVSAEEQRVSPPQSAQRASHSALATSVQYKKQ